MDLQAAFQVSVAGGFKSDASLYPWQLRNVHRALTEYENHKCGMTVADEMGYGKTVSGLLVIAAAKATSGLNTALIVTPPAVETNWARESSKYTNWRRVVAWRDLTKSEREALFREPVGPDAVIISHKAVASIFTQCYEKVKVEAFQKSEACFYNRWMPKKDTAVHPIFTKKFAAVVFDEAHILRNPKTAMFAGGMFAGRHATMHLCLSGTPHQNCMKDFVSQMRLCHGRPEFQEDGAFDRCYPTFLTRLHASSLTRATEKVDLPPRVDKRNAIPMPEAEGAVFDGLMERIVTVLDKFAKSAVSYDRVLAEFTRIRKATVSQTLLEEEDAGEEDESAEEREDESLGRNPRPPIDHAKRANAIMEAPSAKIQECMRRIGVYTSEGRKTVVFCSFVDPLLAMCEMVNELKEGSATVYFGEMAHAEKEVALHTFNTDPECMVLFVSLLSGGTGLNLQVASRAIIIDHWWNPSVEEQAKFRIWRPGQKLDCVWEKIEYQASYDDACVDLYHCFKNENSKNLLSGVYHPGAEVQFNSSAAASLIEEIAVRRGLAEVARRAAEVHRKINPVKKSPVKVNKTMAAVRKLKEERAAAVHAPVKKVVKPCSSSGGSAISRAYKEHQHAARVKERAIQAAKAARRPQTLIEIDF